MVAHPAPDPVVWTGGQPNRPRRRPLVLAAVAGAASAVVAASLGLWLVSTPATVQGTSWDWFQARVVHADAGDRLLTGIERHDRQLFEGAVSRTCGDHEDELCLDWHYDQAIFHRHWGHISYRSKSGEVVSVWNVNRLVNGPLGDEEIVQAWGFVYDARGLIKKVL